MTGDQEHQIISKEQAATMTPEQMRAHRQAETKKALDLHLAAEPEGAIISSIDATGQVRVHVTGFSGIGNLALATRMAQFYMDNAFTDTLMRIRMETAEKQRAEQAAAEAPRPAAPQPAAPGLPVPEHPAVSGAV